MYSLFSLTDFKNSSSILETIDIAPAAQTGLPPKVEPCEPGVTVSFNLSPKSTAPIGSPPASPFAVDTISGLISKFSYAKYLPDLPLPFCTSSTTISISFSFASFSIAFTKS